MPRRAPRALVVGAVLAAIAVGVVVRGCGGSTRAPQVKDFGADAGELFFAHRRHLDAAPVDRPLAELASDGLGVIRAAPLWEFTEPSPPRGRRHHYDWRFDDFIARRLAAHGMRWVAVLAFAPRWASARPGELHGAPARPGDFAAYAGAFAHRYRGRIAAYEVWNEENSGVFWRPAPDPRAYAELYRATQAAVHAADPGVPVLVGGLANTGGTSFLAALLPALGPGAAPDGVAIHPYGRDPLEVLERVRAYRRELEALGAGTLPLYVTEYGWATRPPDNPTWASEAQRPAYLREAAVQLLRSDCNVPLVTFYAAVTAERQPYARDDWYGVLAPDSSTSLAAGALRQTASELGSAKASTYQICGT